MCGRSQPLTQNHVHETSSTVIKYQHKNEILMRRGETSLGLDGIELPTLHVETEEEGSVWVTLTPEEVKVIGVKVIGVIVVTIVIACGLCSVKASSASFG